MKKTGRRPQRKIMVPRFCYFCKEKKVPDFSETEVLQRFITERGKIMPGARNGLCARHQKDLTISIKYARYLALLPYIAYH